MGNESERLSKAIDRLAALMPNGELSVAMDPAGFLGQVADEITRLRGSEKCGCSRPSCPFH